MSSPNPVDPKGEAVSKSPAFREYALTLGGVALATGVRFALDPILGEHAPFTTFLIPLAAVAWRFKVGPLIVGIVASILLGDYCFATPRFSFGFATGTEWLVVLFFLLTLVVIRATSRQERV